MPLASGLFHIIFTPLLLFASLGFNMLRRLSTFRRSRKEEESATKVNGAFSNGKKALTNGSAAPQKEPARAETHGQEKDAQGLLEQFAQLVHASRRPLPTQSGDGAYLEHEVPSSIFADLKTLGFKDVKTLMEVMTSKKGTLQDDKTYIMERVIQVCLMDSEEYNLES
jgi:linoleate 10R-lipoxygenase